jgi:hypothetical protein
MGLCFCRELKIKVLPSPLYFVPKPNRRVHSSSVFYDEVEAQSGAFCFMGEVAFGNPVELVEMYF